MYKLEVIVRSKGVYSFRIDAYDQQEKEHYPFLHSKQTFSEAGMAYKHGYITLRQVEQNLL